MATCLEIVTDAADLARVPGLGRGVKAAEAEKGMGCLQSLYDFWLANGMFGELEDTYLTQGDTAEEGKRYYTNGQTLTAATSVYTDSTGTVRQPRDLSVYEVFDGTDRTVKLYDRTEWVDLLELELTDTAPLSGRGRMGLAAALATSGAFIACFMRGETVNPDVYRLARSFVGQIMQKRGSTRDHLGAEFL